LDVEEKISQEKGELHEG